MKRTSIRARWLGIAACVAALALLIAAVIAGKAGSSHSFARLAHDDAQRL